MKKIFYLLAVLASLLMFFTGSALAKEYRIDKAKASFDIPNGYNKDDVIDKMTKMVDFNHLDNFYKPGDDNFVMDTTDIAKKKKAD